MIDREVLVSYATALAGIVLLSILWVAVQSRWRKAFPEASSDPDVLAGRMECHGCEHKSSQCSERGGTVGETDSCVHPPPAPEYGEKSTDLRSTNEE